MPEAPQEPIKVFISYSHTTPAHVAWVRGLAERLENHYAFTVTLDQWDLRTGHDITAFMERIASDNKLIDKVIVILEKGYTEKANSRTRGVGVEAQIISNEVYRSINQDKFLPIVRETDDSGEAYIPIFLKSRLYIDFTDENKFEESLDKLKQDLVGVSAYIRPQKSERLPAHYFDKTIKARKTQQLASGIDTVLSNRPQQLDTKVREFLDEFYQAVGEFKLSLDSGHDSVSRNEALSESLFKMLDAYVPFRDDLLLFFRKIVDSGQVFDDRLVIDFLANLYQYTELSPPNRGSYEVEFFKFILLELFLHLIGLFLYRNQFLYIDNLLHSHYPINLSYTNQTHQPYVVFYSFSQEIDTRYQALRKQKNPQNHSELRSPLSTLLMERCSSEVPSGYLIEADLVCYHIGELFSITKYQNFSSGWYPLLHIYSGKSEKGFFQNIVSKRFFEKVKGVYGVNSSTDLINLIKEYKAQYENTNNSWGRSGSITPIFRLVDVEQIGIHR